MHCSIPLKQSVVIKATGLASGKGVFVCRSKPEAKAVLNELMLARSLGDAGNIVLIEDYLEGDEVSVSISGIK